MPKIDLSALPVRVGSGYPAPYAAMMGNRRQISIGPAAGLTQFGVNLVTLGPGGFSSLRHWHENQDEFLMVTQGICTLIDDHGETELRVGDCAAFPAGDANGHHLTNKTDSDAVFLVVGTHTPTETGHYSDVDLHVTSKNGVHRFTRRDGSAHEGEE